MRKNGLFCVETVWFDALVEVNTFDLQLDHDYWFDFFHTHLDFWGVGKNSLKIRREHIKAHVALYNRTLKLLEGLKSHIKHGFVFTNKILHLTQYISIHQIQTITTSRTRSKS